MHENNISKIAKKNVFNLNVNFTKLNSIRKKMRTKVQTLIIIRIANTFKSNLPPYKLYLHFYSQLIQLIQLITDHNARNL